MIPFHYNDHLDALLRQEKQLIDIGAYKDNILTKDVGKWKAMKEVKHKKVLLQDQIIMYPFYKQSNRDKVQRQDYHLKVFKALIRVVWCPPEGKLVLWFKLITIVK